MLVSSGFHFVFRHVNAKCRSKIPSSSKVLLNFCWLNKINFDGVFGTNFDRESSEKTHFSAFGGTSSGPPGGGSLGLAQRGNSPVDISIFIFISGASIYDIYCIFQYYRDTILVFFCANVFPGQHLHYY